MSARGDRGSRSSRAGSRSSSARTSRAASPEPTQVMASVSRSRRSIKPVPAPLVAGDTPLDDAADAGEVAASDVPQLLASFVDGLGVDTPPPAPPRAASPISSPATSTVLQLHHLLLKDAAELKAMLREMDDSLAAACFELPSWRTLLTFIINKKGAENRNSL